MSAEKLDTDVRQEQIAQAALELVAAKGIKGLSVAAVARRIGLVPSALYRHFKGKDAVLDAAVALVGIKMQANIHAVMQETSNPLDRLHQLLTRHVRMIRENVAIPRIIFSEDIFSGNPQRRKRVHQMLAGYLDEVARMIQDGQRQGKIRADADARVLSVMFLGLILPAGILWHISDGGFDVTRQTQRAWKVFCQAIQA